MAVDPGLVLDGDVPRLIDEWQVEPTIWNHIRRTIDDRGKPGQFILTGSAVPADEITRHTGAGRLTRLRMRPMSLAETGHSSAKISLEQLLQGQRPRSPATDLSVKSIAECVSAGGWPGHLRLDLEESIRAVRDYLDEIRRIDIGRVDQTKRDPQRVGRLLQSYARNVATCTSNSTLAADAGGAEGPLAEVTVADYLSALERLMIIEDQPAWATHLRSKSILRQAPKRHFVDPSLAAAALRANPDRLFQDLNLFGFLFESLVVRDLRIYAQALDASVYHYRDNTGLEVDAVVQAADGRWAAFEIKLGVGHVDDGAASLLKFAGRVDTERTGKPSALAVITSTGFGYVRPDGIGVVPVSSLGP